MKDIVFTAIEGQCFDDFNGWVAFMQDNSNLPNHHSNAIFFDQNGRWIRDIISMDNFPDGSLPIWYVWPNQISELLMQSQK